MIVRIVKMFVEPGKQDSFNKIMNSFEEKILEQPGCLHRDVFNEKNNPDIHYSYTIWDSEKNLEKYRKSALLKEISDKITPLCTREPQAWTVDKVFEK